MSSFVAYATKDLPGPRQILRFAQDDRALALRIQHLLDPMHRALQVHQR